ncbi:MAG: sel1 repeat family protein, partial [Oceanospirillaceae bacterium]|nr:sel1 repeat family protein [Oceanospirillaceae bacterium]
MNHFFRLLVGATMVAMCALPAHAASFKQAKKHYAAADYSAAIAELQPLAKAGNADANNLLGEMYLQGAGVNSDITLAKTFFEAGARVGHLAALANLADILNREYKVELVTLEPLAEAGNAKAQNRLGRMYEFGQGHSINPQAAYAWYKKAADQGLMNGRMNLARAHNFGLGTEQDFVKAEA